MVLKVDHLALKTVGLSKPQKVSSLDFDEQVRLEFESSNLHSCLGSGLTQD
jgi:hypothetical protein